jgi:hypothetical protein
MSGKVNSTGAVSGIVGTTVGTPSSNAADIGAGVLPVGVTGGSGLTALGTVATGNLSNTAIVYPNGHIKQISAMAHTYTQTGFTSATLADFSGMTCALTPTDSTNKIIVMGTAHVYGEAGQNVNVVLMRDDGGGFDQLLALADYLGTFTGAGADLLPICFIDAPGVAVEVTYKLQYRSDSAGTCYVNVNDGSSVSTHQEGSNSYLYCMEIVA